MALPLEEKIMAEIGLGQNYRWFNGSGSCRYIRTEAAARLPMRIAYHAAKNEIAAPNAELCDLVGEVARRGDSSSYSLTNTWQAASEVIQAHIHACHEQDGGAALFARIAQYIRENHLSQEDEWAKGWDELRDKRWRK